MEDEITPDCLSCEELVHELAAQGPLVSDVDLVEKLAFNLNVFLSMELDVILFDTGVKLDSEPELTRCKEILDEIRTLFTRVLDETILRIAATKLAHLKGRLGCLTAEPGAQTEAKGRLCADLDRVIAGFKSRAKFFNGVANVSARLEPSVFPGVALTPLVEPGCGPGPSLGNHNWAQVIWSWNIAFQGDRKDELSVLDFLVEVDEKCASHDLPQDDLLRHAKMFFRALEALVWYRMTESPVSSWTANT
jgi:hypothetical protein